ncbi:hypothetical protein GCM10023310_09460 [Paenibacillus vulneris]|uniref:Uncharacterized protein n=1 Tax=Paenibacillus vulneris TaxID=1133364 RepID=A0ABW3UXZ3_9BACL|nr:MULTISPECIES: hypothetical protein [unclassified Paenibacillus]MBE1443656.1 hypothetical protein [Paenibacillus sp. OAS669]
MNSHSEREEMLWSVSRDTLSEQLKRTIAECRRRTDLPFWGEVFSIIQQMKKIPSDYMPLYELHPVGGVLYDADKRRFVVKIPDMDITLKDAELADAIVKQGLFHPK